MFEKAASNRHKQSLRSHASGRRFWDLGTLVPFVVAYLAVLKMANQSPTARG